MSTNKTFAKLTTNKSHKNYSILNYAEYLRERTFTKSTALENIFSKTYWSIK